MVEQLKRRDWDGKRTAWGIRPYARGDEEQAVELFEECFGRPMSAAHYCWKVVDSPWPITVPTVWLADTGERLIGQYAGTPMRFKLGDKELQILHVCDVMTSSDFRRQGVLTAVGTTATEMWQAAGVPFVTGLHYGGWGSRRRYLGWREQFKAAWLWRPLHPTRLLARRNVPGTLSPPTRMAGALLHLVVQATLRLRGWRVRVELVSEPCSAFDQLWEHLKAHYEALVVRDRAWITYRYVEAPGLDYRILLARRDARPVGYLVYRMTVHDDRLTGWIADLFTAPSDTATRYALIHSAVRRLYTAGAESVRVFLAASTPLVGQFHRAGFLPAKGEYDISIVSLADNMPHPALRDPNRWFTMAGDYDVI